ncbi:Ger(x)C family spore germination protein [Paenibacillus qinlingensis]|uniref:Spore germination protein KC n=1 Tax=Paenibacillus qinlingensis TaxID=1837343 RepID=A0ABU1NXI0_9BACL|nr:Ger(x)C family spore germination protein [Paenibacillus qinlingensis]MDR6552173.1 spore germination protein KC [Paenibacillus qinlingensis]
MRHYIVFPVISLCVLLLTGCWDRIEVNDMAFIIAAGIDKSVDHQVEVTVQVFIPNPAASSGEGSAGNGNVYTVSVIGDSMPDALTELQKKFPRYFSWGHAKAYFFGEELARSGMYDDFDFLFRDIQPREQANFFVCRGTAKALLEAQNDPNSYETLIKLSQKPLIRSSTMHDIEEVLSGESGDFLLPVANKSNLISNKSHKSIITVEGMCVIQKGKLVGFLAHESQMGVRLFIHEDLGRNITITDQEDDGKIVIKIITTDLHLKPLIENGIWKMKVQLKLEADVVQNSTDISLANGSDNMRKLEEPFDRQICKILTDTLQQLQKEQKVDVLGFARAFHKKYPREWKKAKEEWPTIYPTIDVELDVKSVIQRPGISNFPIITAQ